MHENNAWGSFAIGSPLGMIKLRGYGVYIVPDYENNSFMVVDMVQNPLCKVIMSKESMNEMFGDSRPLAKVWGDPNHLEKTMEWLANFEEMGRELNNERQ